MLTQVAPGVHVHESEFIQSNAVVVQGPTGVLVVDPGITRSEISTLARDIRDLGSSVIAGFSTHPDWDHVLWHTSLGDVPRYATAAGAAFIREVLTHEDWEEESRDRGDGLTEITTVSRWESMEAAIRFAGDDPERAVFYPEDDLYLVERDERVRHYVQEA